MKRILVISVFFFSVVACKKESSIKGEFLPEVSYFDSRGSKEFFGVTLAKAIKEEPEMREYLRLEALKMFDNDYDVLYQMVKDHAFSDGYSFYEKLVKYSSSKDSLDKAIEMLPLLTMLIPELPTFNAQAWDAQTEVPFVAIEAGENPEGDIVAFDSNGEQFNVPYGLIPASPVIVIKENERIVLSSQNDTYAKKSSTNHVAKQSSFTGSRGKKFLAKGEFSFSFADPIFDNNDGQNRINHLTKLEEISDKPQMLAGAGGPVAAQANQSNSEIVPWRNEPLSEVQHIVDAVNSGVTWHRDNVYYGLSAVNNVTAGALKRNIREFVTSIEFVDPSGYDQIHNGTTDPRPIDGSSIPQQWTNGQFEFVIKALINSSNGAGPDIEKVFVAKPSDLFHLTYEKSGGGRPGGPSTIPVRYLKPSIQRTKVLQLGRKVPLVNWDLESHGTAWKIIVTKYNDIQAVTTEVINLSKFGSNFKLNPLKGLTEKIGFEFGGSAEVSRSHKYTVLTNIGSKSLGNDVINFYSPIFDDYNIYEGYASYIGEGRGRVPVGPLIQMVNYRPYRLSTGSVYLTIEPRL